jgi:menaquinone-9 beta-reductase
MPVRATKRGAERTPLGGAHDVVVCGASFAGLAVARELAGSGADVLVLDRYEIGDRQTSACAAPTEVLERLGLQTSILQDFGELVVHTRFRSFRWRLPFRFATFDYAQLCELLWAQCGDAQFETAMVGGSRDGDDGSVVVETDRGEVRAPLVVDALGWRRVLGRSGAAIKPPAARMSRGLEVNPAGSAADMEAWLDPAVVRRGYGWNFPAGDELRVGIGSFDPRDHVKGPTVGLARHVGVEPDGYQGNWIPHALRDATDGAVFFAGDSAGHCMPATAEGIRPALYFGTVLGRELADAVAGHQTRAQALERYRDFHERHRWAWRWLLRTQRALGGLNPYPALTSVMELMNRPRFLAWSFTKYLGICPPAVLGEPAVPDQ